MNLVQLDLEGLQMAMHPHCADSLEAAIDWVREHNSAYPHLTMCSEDRDLLTQHLVARIRATAKEEA